MTTETLQYGVAVYSCDGDKLGTARSYFSAASEPAVGEPSTERDFQTDSGGVPSISTDVAMLRVNATSDAGGTVLGEGGPPPIDGVAPGRSGVFLAPSDTKYIEVHHGGHLHHGGESLYVPLNAVNVVEPDGSIVLHCTKAEATERYAQRPAPLDGE